MSSIFSPHCFRNRVLKTEKVDFIVAERIREARIVRALDQDEAAELLGMSQQRLGRLENNHDQATKEELIRFMKVYGFPRGFFYVVRWERI